VPRGRGAATRRASWPQSWAAAGRGLVGEEERRDEGLQGRSMVGEREDGEGERGREGELTSATRRGGEAPTVGRGEVVTRSWARKLGIRAEKLCD
jgi:hypothetical protein